jgi:hypothetical protein
LPQRGLPVSPESENGCPISLPVFRRILVPEAGANQVNPASMVAATRPCTRKVRSCWALVATTATCPSDPFFEGVMTAGIPTDAADDAVQANIVAAGYAG